MGNELGGESRKFACDATDRKGEGQGKEGKHENLPATDRLSHVLYIDHAYIYIYIYTLGFQPLLK